MIAVHSQGEIVAYINKQSREADGYVQETPWLLLYVNGRIRRFGSRAEARDEALKSWVNVQFKRI